MSKAIRVIGVGNSDRGDDAIGPMVAAAVADQDPVGVEVVVAEADPSQLIESWDADDTVVLIDAVLDRSEPGTVAVFDAAAHPVPADPTSLSSHGLGIPGTVELARALGRMPERLMVVGVTGQVFDGVGLSPPVERAIPDAVDAVMEVVDHA